MAEPYFAIYSENKLIGLFPERMYLAAAGSICSHIGRGRKYILNSISDKEAQEKAKEMGLEGKINKGFAFFKP